MKSHRHLVALLLALVAITAVAAGCGSSSKSKSTGGGAPLTKAEFLKRGNAICAQGNKDVNAEGRKMFGNKPKKRPTPAEIHKFATAVLIPSVTSQVDKIAALSPPKGDESKVKAIVDAARQGIAKGKKDPSSLAQSGPGPFAKANALARAYGLKVCGS